MIFLSAGHNFGDPGAIGNGYKENELCMELRSLIYEQLLLSKANVILDKDSETLGQYITRIKPGSGSVVCELHFNAVSNASATGVEVFYPDTHKSINKSIAAEMSAELACIMQIKDRGAKLESSSARGRLAILRTGAGISFLPELAFISNANDMIAYQTNKVDIAKCITKYLLIAEDQYK